jgi:hypothetical protein
MISEIFPPKKLAKILAFFAQTNASFYKNFEKIANFLPKIVENRRKL